MSRNLWKYEEIKGHWDQIQIRSWATKSGKKVLYQESTLANDPAARGADPPGAGQRVAGPMEGIAILFRDTAYPETEGMIFRGSI